QNFIEFRGAMFCFPYHQHRARTNLAAGADRKDKVAARSMMNATRLYASRHLTKSRVHSPQLSSVLPLMNDLNRPILRSSWRFSGLWNDPPLLLLTIYKKSVCFL